MSKSLKKMLAAVGWLGSSGYQTIVYTTSTKSGRVQAANDTSDRKATPKVPARPRTRI